MPVRVVDAYEVARSMRTTFADRDVEYEETLHCSWPARLHHVGDSLAVAYGSDKWKKLGARGKRDFELYKHVAESRNSVYIKKDLFKNFSSPVDPWPVYGEMTSLASYPMPSHFAILGTFEEVDLQLYVGRHATGKYFFGDGDDGIVKATVENAVLGASKIMWSAVSNRPDEPFLFVYTDANSALLRKRKSFHSNPGKQEIVMLIGGLELDVEGDGIVG